MNENVTVEVILGALAAQGILTLQQARVLSREIEIRYSGEKLDNIRLSDVYEYLKPICDAHVRINHD